MFAIGTKTALIHGTSAVATWVGVAICATSVAGIIMTVHLFRSAYRPIVYAYNCHVSLEKPKDRAVTADANITAGVQKAQVAPAP